MITTTASEYPAVSSLYVTEFKPKGGKYLFFPPLLAKIFPLSHLPALVIFAFDPIGTSPLSIFPTFNDWSTNP